MFFFYLGTLAYYQDFMAERFNEIIVYFFNDFRINIVKFRLAILVPCLFISTSKYMNFRRLVPRMIVGLLFYFIGKILGFILIKNLVICSFSSTSFLHCSVEYFSRWKSHWKYWWKSAIGRKTIQCIQYRNNIWRVYADGILDLWNMRNGEWFQ